MEADLGVVETCRRQSPFTSCSLPANPGVRRNAVEVGDRRRLNPKVAPHYPRNHFRVQPFIPLPIIPMTTPKFAYIPKIRVQPTQRNVTPRHVPRHYLNPHETPAIIDLARRHDPYRVRG